MLGKLFSHELRRSSRLLAALHGAMLLLALLLFGIGCLPGIPAGHFLMGVLQVFGVLAIAAICFATIFSFAFRFYRSVFSDEGYLTNTLPVTAGQLLLAKLLTAILWLAVDLLLCFLSLCLITRQNLFARILMEIRQSDGAAFLGFMAFLVAASLLLALIMMYSAVAIGNLFGGHRVIGSIVSYFALYTLMQILFLIPFLIFLPNLLTLPAGQLSLMELQLQYPQAYGALTSCLGVTALFNLLFSILLYLLTWRLMDRHLNLE